MQNTERKIIISRTDSIGDVVLTLPMAGLIKRHLPNSRVYFLGRTYTEQVIALSQHVDEFINYDHFEKLDDQKKMEAFKKIGADTIIHVFPKGEIAGLARRAGIELRVGTTNRFYHWFTCNKLIRLSRKNSQLHEAQLNFKLLSFLNVDTEKNLAEIQSFYGFSKIPVLENDVSTLIDKTKYNVILHPKSKGSAREWGLDNFEKLIALLPDSRYNIFISGTSDDARQMHAFLKRNPKAVDLTGKLNLRQFIGFIANADALVAASTGPLHIAAALGKNAIGLFSPRRPIHPGRWAPVGKNAHALVFDENCERCSKGEECDCINHIDVKQIVDLLQ